MEKLQPGINHIEFWVANLNVSLEFYSNLFLIIGWDKHGKSAFTAGQTEIYFKEAPNISKVDSLGARHFCFQAVDKAVVEKVYNLLIKFNLIIIRGPIEMNYSPGYYTVDFIDPDNNIIEVAYTPKVLRNE